MRDHGLRYLLTAIVLAGIIRIGAGLLRLGCFMRFVSKSKMTRFVNPLTILIFMAQRPRLDPAQVRMLTYALVAGGLAIIHLFPRLTRAVPSRWSRSSITGAFWTRSFTDILRIHLQKTFMPLQSLYKILYWHQQYTRSAGVRDRTLDREGV